MYTRMNPVSERDVVRQLVQLAIYVQYVPIRAWIDFERKAIRAWHVHISSRSGQQGPNLLAAIDEEFQRGDTGASDCAVPRRIARMRGGAFREGLWQQVASIRRVNDGQDS